MQIWPQIIGDVTLALQLLYPVWTNVQVAQY